MSTRRILLYATLSLVTALGAVALYLVLVWLGR